MTRMHPSGDGISDSVLPEILRPAIDVIVLNWNGKDDTLACLESLLRLAYPNFRILVVDNSSTDGSVDAIRRRHPTIEIIETGANLGYAGGNNAGLRASLAAGVAEYVLILNNDTDVDSTLLDALIEASAMAPKLSVIGPVIHFMDPPDQIWFAGAYWNSALMQFDHLNYRRSAPDVGRECYPTDYVTGCALFMSTDTLRKVGLLDERFFLIYEEVEWCYRLRKLGGTCLIAPRAQLRHRVSASFGGQDVPLVQYFMARNELLWAEHALGLRDRMRMFMSALVSTVLPEAWHTHRPPIPLLKRIYWSLLSSASWNFGVYRGAAYRCRRAGFRDYVLRRFGDCPRSIRTAR